MDSLVGDPAPKRIRLSEQDHSTVIERGRGIEFDLQDVEFDDVDFHDDGILDEIVDMSDDRLPPLLSPDGMAVFTVLSYYSFGRMDICTSDHFIVRHSLTDGQSSCFRVVEFDGIRISDKIHCYALSNDRLGALVIDNEQWILHQYVIRFGHRPRLAEVTARHSLPLGPDSYYSGLSLQLDDRIMLPSKSSPILILAADIEAPESNKYCHCCRLDGYSSRLEIEARNHNVPPPSFKTLTLGRNGVYVCVRPENGTESFCVLGLEWRRNNELPADLCHRHAKDTVSVFYRFDQQSVNTHDGDWFQVASNGFAAFMCQRTPPRDRNQSGSKRKTLDVFVLDLTRLVHGDAHPEMRCTQSTISVFVYGTFRDSHLSLVPGTSSVIIELGYPNSLLHLRSAFDVPPLRQLAFEAVYKNMKPEERSKPGWMQTLCGFECV